MSHFLEQCLHDEVTHLCRELAFLSVSSVFDRKKYLNESQLSHVSSVDNGFGGFGMVYTEVTAFKKGVVRFQDAWWFALSNSDVTIHPGQQVHVMQYQGSTLIVEPC